MNEIFGGHFIEITVAAVAAIVVGMIGGSVTDVGPWYENLKFPKLTPPNWAFAPAWTLIYAVIATAGVLAWIDAPDAATGRGLLIAFAVNGVFNVAWSPLFFSFKRPDWAFIELIPFWLSVLALVVYTAPFSPRAAELLLIYLAWVTYAGWLNWQIVKLNRPFGGRSAREAK